MIHFEIPKNQSSIIKVIGVGGGGGNAVNYMYKLGINGVDFVVCNTDSQALAQSPIPNKIQLGPHLTQGLGAGAKPEVGMKAGEESEEDIRKILEVNTKMAFITAGMGGGTGTGAAPIIAKICKELGILTVGIVTTPFAYEGKKRIKQADEGIKNLEQNVDTILIINNDKLRQQFGNLPYIEAFSRADNILATAAKCITDLITVDGRVNLDFNDVQTVMRDGGRAILGSALASGENRAMIAVEEALSSPLLNDNEIDGAKWILLNVNSAPGEYQHTLDELEIIQGYVQEKAGHNCDIILGMGEDESLGENIGVSIIATGFTQQDITNSYPEQEKVLVELEHPKKTNAPNEESNKPKTVKEINIDPYAPTLVDVDRKSNVTNPNLKVIDTNASDAYNNEDKSPLNKAEEKDNTMKLVERDTPLTELELEQERRFQEQKKALEERAEKLRNMTSSVSGTHDHSEIENVPAYKRKDVQLEQEKDESLSGYTTDGNFLKKNGLFNTINTFLNGKKPD